MSDDLEQRIRQRAYRLWIEEGQPQGKPEAHWELARIAIALEDAKPQMQRPIAGPTAEPVDAWRTRASFRPSPIKASSMLPANGSIPTAEAVDPPWQQTMFISDHFSGTDRPS